MPVHLEQTGKSDALVCPVKVIDLAPLKETVSRFVDFDRLKRRNEGLIHDDSSDTPRLIMTSTDIQRGEAVVFDNTSGPSLIRTNFPIEIISRISPVWSHIAFPMT